MKNKIIEYWEMEYLERIHLERNLKDTGNKVHQLITERIRERIKY